MKKFFLLIFTVSLCLTIFPKETLKIGAYTGYFSPRDNTLKQIYSKDNIVYGIKIGARIWKTFYIWISGEHFSKSSETTLLGDTTKLTVNPITLSLGYSIPLGKIKPYIGAGYTYFYYKERSDIGNVSGEGQGYSLNTGIEFGFSSSFRLDLGLVYSDGTVKPTGFNVQLGGLQASISFLIVI
jgi:opacity protein-like surface antigen